MAWCIVLCMLAAFGALSALWAMFGWLLPGGTEGVIVCHIGQGMPESFFLWRYVLLRELGLLGCRLIVVDCGMTEAQSRWLQEQRGGIEICSPEGLSSRLELERDRIG